MKISILALVIASFTTTTLLTSCSSSAQKVENAQKGVENANKELDEAKNIYLVDIETFRKATEGKFAANEKSIDGFNKRIVNEKKESIADYQKKMAELNKRNLALIKKLNNYQADGYEKWEIFKKEFNHDMEELDKSISNFFIM